MLTWPRAIRSLTRRFLGAEVELQVQVFHHVTQLIIVRVLPKLQGIMGNSEQEEPRQLACLCPLKSILGFPKEIGPRRSKGKARATEAARNIK